MADVEVSVVDNFDLVKEALDENIEKALIAIGLTAESYAKMPEGGGGHTPVDTGRLKNSVTYAIAGQAPHITSYGPDRAVPNDNQSRPYSGNAPPDSGGAARSVYIGSNVEYAPIVENGMSGKYTGKHFLQRAISDHIQEYKDLTEQALKGQG